MLYRIIGLKLKPDESDNKLTALAARELSVRPDQICSLRIYRKSLDARRDRVLYQYTVDVTLKTKPISVSERCKSWKRSMVTPFPASRWREGVPLWSGLALRGCFVLWFLPEQGCVR